MTFLQGLHASCGLFEPRLIDRLPIPPPGLRLYLPLSAPRRRVPRIELRRRQVAQPRLQPLGVNSARPTPRSTSAPAPDSPAPCRLTRSLYIGANNRIRRVAPDGIITTIAFSGGPHLQCGVPNPPTCANREPAMQSAVALERFGNLVAAPDGSILFPTHSGEHRVRRVVPFFRMYDSTGIAIASEDGAEVYEFDANGRHLRTRAALSNHVLLRSRTIPQAA